MPKEFVIIRWQNLVPRIRVPFKLYTCVCWTMNWWNVEPRKILETRPRFLVKVEYDTLQTYNFELRFKTDNLLIFSLYSKYFENRQISLCTNAVYWECTFFFLKICWIAEFFGESWSYFQDSLDEENFWQIKKSDIVVYLISL